MVVDLAGVTCCIDSSAISALLNARRRVAGERRELRVEHLTGPVARVLELGGLTTILADTATPDVDEE